MKLDISPLPFTDDTYYHGFYLVDGSAGRKARHEKPKEARRKPESKQSSKEVRTQQTPQKS